MFVTLLESIYKHLYLLIDIMYAYMNRHIHMHLYTYIHRLVHRYAFSYAHACVHLHMSPCRYIIILKHTQRYQEKHLHAHA